MSGGLHHLRIIGAASSIACKVSGAVSSGIQCHPVTQMVTGQPPKASGIYQRSPLPILRLCS